MRLRTVRVQRFEGSIFALAFFILSMPGASAWGQAGPVAAIHGTVADSAGKPVAGVEVSVLHAAQRTQTDSEGRFQLLSVDSGVHVLVARHFGFRPETTSVKLDSRITTLVRFVLRPAPAVLEKINVRDSAHIPPRFDDFERRRSRRLGGQYITQADIERRRPRSTSDILRGVLGIKMIDSMGVTLAVSSRGPKTSLIGGVPVPVPCVLRVGVDGSIKEPYFPVNLISPLDIYGIEIHHSASMPAEFGGARQNAFCGLVMIWTK